MIKNILKILLIILAFVIIYSTVSNAFDPDLGWHLRFGKEAASGAYPYLDSYTWTYYGNAWVNHEWGGDIVFWLIYEHLGYIALLLLISLIILAPFLLAHKIFSANTGLISLIVSIISLWSIRHIMVMRLAMFAPLFSLLIWWSLEKIKDRKIYYFWPLIFWVWASLHGSWILGFMVIAIYFVGNLVDCLLRQKGINFFAPSQWKKKTFFAIILWSAISALTINLNPYGHRIWTEIISYFRETFFKRFITEWVPSYTFPVYWQSLLITAVGIAFFLFALSKKKNTLAQTLLFFAFLISSFLYKRNAIFMVLICTPLLSITLEKAIIQIKNYFKPILFLRVFLVAASFFSILTLLFSYGAICKFPYDIWKEKELLTAQDMPVAAVEFLKQHYANKQLKIFTFGWGGYLEWELPSALVFLDGRGTATWRLNKQETLLERYLKIQFEKGGLAELNKSPANLILLRNPKISDYPAPDFVNRMLFSQNDFKKIYANQPSQLEIDLEKSEDWHLVYTDELSKAWERK